MPPIFNTARCWLALPRSEEHTSELQSLRHLVCRLLLEKKKNYHGGYLPEERRRIERALFDGDLLGVVSKNALELDIRRGGSDAETLNGRSTRVAHTWT